MPQILCDGRMVDFGLRTLPTKEDFRGMAANMEAALKKEMQVVRGDIHGLQTRQEVVEVTVGVANERVKRLENALHDAELQMCKLRLLLEKKDDKGRRLNLRIKGLPELTGKEDLISDLKVLFRLAVGINNNDYP